MLINNKDIITFNAKLLGYETEASDIDINTFETIDNTIYYGNEVKRKELSVKLYFKGETRETVLANISSFLSEIAAESTIQFNTTDNYSYSCIYLKSKIEKVTTTHYIIEYTFSTIQRKDLVTLTPTILADAEGNKYFNIVNSGTAAAPIKVTVTPLAATYSINDINICNLTINSSLIIDGIEKTVKENGTNKFQDTELFEFPKLKLGTNKFKVSDDSVVTIEYYPKMI